MVNKREPEGTRVPGLVWQAASVPQPWAANLMLVGGDFRLESGSQMPPHFQSRGHAPATFPQFFGATLSLRIW